MGEISKFQKSLTLEIQILKPVDCPQSINNNNKYSKDQKSIQSSLNNEYK